MYTASWPLIFSSTMWSTHSRGRGELGRIYCFICLKFIIFHLNLYYVRLETRQCDLFFYCNNSISPLFKPAKLYRLLDISLFCCTPLTTFLFHSKLLGHEQHSKKSLSTISLSSLRKKWTTTSTSLCYGDNIFFFLWICLILLQDTALLTCKVTSKFQVQYISHYKIELIGDLWMEQLSNSFTRPVCNKKNGTMKGRSVSMLSVHLSRITRKTDSLTWSDRCWETSCKVNI